MKYRFSIAVLLAASLAPLANPAAPFTNQDQGSNPKILTGKDFEMGSNRSSSGKETVTLKLQINPKLPPFTLRLIPEKASGPQGTSTSRQPVGEIHVMQGDSSTAGQVIRVKTYTNASNFIGFFTAKDINFDGYLDLGVVDEFGAKWGRYQWWLFDARRRRFIKSSLTSELLTLSGNMEIDEGAREIRVLNFIGTCPQNRTYKITNSHLVLMEATERDCELNKVHARLKKRINGRMKIIRTWDENP